MKRFFLLLAALCSFRAFADLQTTTVQITGTPSAGNTITVNSTVRTWQTTVTVPSSQIQIGGSLLIDATNLYVQLAANQIPGVHVAMIAADTVRVQSENLTLSASGTWSTLVNSTNVETPTFVVRVPLSSEPTPAMATNIASLAVSGLGAYATSYFFENQTLVKNLAGLTNDQTIAGSKAFTNVLAQWWGIVSNSPAISGKISALSNGVIWLPKIASPTTTNLANFGNAISSPGSAVFSEQLGSGAVANNAGALAVGRSAAATGQSSLAVGNGSLSSGDNSSAVGTGSTAGALNSSAIGAGATVGSTHQGATAIGFSASTTDSNQIMVGTSSSYAKFPGSVKIDGNTTLAWKRFPITSLANGANAAIPITTNTFCELSGPSGAFTVNGIAAGFDGQFLILLNQTGQNMTVAHDSGTDPTAANRIYSMTGADQTTTGNGAATLIYSSAASRWIMISFAP